MPRILSRSCMLAALLALSCGNAAEAPAPAGSAQAKAKLAAVRARISDLTTHLGTELAQRDALNARLRAADLAILEKRKRLESLHAAQLAADRRRDELIAEQRRNQSALQAERGTLDAQMRAAYMIGQQEQIKLLLNQGNPAIVGRMLIYYGYFARERSARIAAIADRVAILQGLVGEIERQTAALQALEAGIRGEMADLERARAERSDAAAALAKQVTDGNQELLRLKREEQAVESLIADLSRVLQDFPRDTQQSFDALRGKLPWPVLGRLTAHYQEPRTSAAQAGVRWNGVMIETARGAKVRAPYFGRVVYADWLQGLGNLLIIAHSGGYLTLYGHAEVLYKSVGDVVSPGDLIAALSDANGAAPQLYFEIRDGRKTVDPTIWLKPGQ
jgi:septal ring factor EnvC (AmiA/AmiB activator)